MAFRAFITGIGGFVGSHLTEALIRTGHHLEGTVRPGGPLQNLEHLTSRARLHRCDIRFSPCVLEAIREAGPDVVFHLAAASSVSEAEKDPKGTLETNLLGTLHLLEAIRKAAPSALLVHVSSPEVYGRVLPEESPIREAQREAPVNHYGLSKFLSEQVVRFYQNYRGLAAVTLRPFNHIGPRQSDRFVCSSFVRQLARIEQGRAEPVLHVGNLDPVRDFTDVRDVVEAYRLAVEHCRPGSLYHVASGKGVSIAGLLDEILSLTHLRIEVRQDMDRLRKTEVPVLVGDAASFVEATGWQRKFELRDSLTDMLEYWRRQDAAQPER